MEIDFAIGKSPSKKYCPFSLVYGICAGAYTGYVNLEAHT